MATSYCGTCGEQITNEFDERPESEQRDEHDCPGRRLCAMEGCTNEARGATGHLGRLCDGCQYDQWYGSDTA